MLAVGEQRWPADVAGVCGRGRGLRTATNSREKIKEERQSSRPRLSRRSENPDILSTVGRIF